MTRAGVHKERHNFSVENLPVDHLMVLTGRNGIYEHARLTQPRLEHGYCLDDNGRALVVICRAASCGISIPLHLSERCLDYVISAKQEDRWRDRRSTSDVWQECTSDDAIGRALWGLGSAASWWPEPQGALRAQEVLTSSLQLRSAWWRPYAYATLGLTAWQRWPDKIEGWPRRRAIDAIGEAADHLPRPRKRGRWLWPEERLRYDNARLPEALLAAGAALDDLAMIDDGLRLLEWLVAEESGSQGFSFTPVAGRGKGDTRPAFDQQPLEAWAMADACFRAADVAGDDAWITPAGVAVAWFLGENDLGLEMYDRVTGAGYDGLLADGVNLNQGAESTLAALATILAPRKPPAAP